MTENQILIVDDELDICEQLVGVLEDKGFRASHVSSSEAALETLKKKNISLILLDIWLNNSKFDGFQTLEKILQIDNSIPVIMISGHGNIETAVNSIKKGAYDFIEKPFDSDLLIFKVKKALENFKLKKKIQQIGKKNYVSKIVANSDAMTKTLESIKKISKTESSILLFGDVGMGKTFTAKQIHDKSNRNFKNFRIIDCYTNNGNQFEIELFGNEVNQVTEFPGIFDEVNGGTILFKNFDLISKKIQGKLLRILEEKKYFRIGGYKPRPINFRIIATSRTSLSKIKSEKKIRNDLLKKLDFSYLSLPNISERKKDIYELIEIFLIELNENGFRKKRFTSNVLDFLCNLNNIKNFSQLKKLVEWIVIMLEEEKDDIDLPMIKDLVKDFMDEKNIPFLNNQEHMDCTLKKARENFEKDYLLYNLSKYNFNISKMSSKIGMERTALYRKLKLMKINSTGLKE